MEFMALSSQTAWMHRCLYERTVNEQRECGLDHGRRPVSHLHTEVQSEDVQPPGDASPIPVRILSRERILTRSQMGVRAPVSMMHTSWSCVRGGFAGFRLLAFLAYPVGGKGTSCRSTKDYPPVGHPLPLSTALSSCSSR